MERSEQFYGGDFVDGYRIPNENLFAQQPQENNWGPVVNHHYYGDINMERPNQMMYRMDYPNPQSNYMPMHNVPLYQPPTLQQGFTQKLVRNKQPQKRTRTAFTSAHLQLLTSEFQLNRCPSKRRKIEIAEKLNLTEKQVTTWFKNRRSKYNHEHRSTATPCSTSTVSSSPQSMASLSPQSSEMLPEESAAATSGGPAFVEQQSNGLPSAEMPMQNSEFYTFGSQNWSDAVNGVPVQKLVDYTFDQWGNNVTNQLNQVGGSLDYQPNVYTKPNLNGEIYGQYSLDPRAMQVAEQPLMWNGENTETSATYMSL